jgi:hypothetical protein
MMKWQASSTGEWEIDREGGCDENENASDSIRFNLDSGSNKINGSDSQFSKRDEQRISTWHVISIDLRFEYENAFNSIRFNDDDSNEIDESGLQFLKHDPRVSTWDGITIDSCIEYQNVLEAIRFQ